MRDLSQIISFLLTLWFFITPICFPESKLPKASLVILGKNPIYTLVHGYRSIFLYNRPPEFHSLWKLWILSAVVCVGGYAWFHKLRKSFPDVV
jgi:lipopolysaccharide transport system permease protein